MKCCSSPRPLKYKQTDKQTNKQTRTRFSKISENVELCLYQGSVLREIKFRKSVTNAYEELELKNGGEVRKESNISLAIRRYWMYWAEVCAHAIITQFNCLLGILIPFLSKSVIKSHKVGVKWEKSEVHQSFNMWWFS